MLPVSLRRCLLPTVLLLAAAPALADPLSDGFEGGRIPSQVWSPCLRPEGRFFIEETVVRSGRYAAGMALLPTPDLPPSVEVASNGHRRSGCIDSDRDMEFMPGSDQRAELWLRDMPPKGTDLWYGFSFRIDAPPAPEADAGRFLVGQWKQAGQYSPFLGQRFRNRKFYLTVEQDGPAKYQQCRVLVAWEDGYDFSDFPPHHSFLHDGFDETGARLPPDYTANCGSDLSIDRKASLPSPYGAWVDMVVHIKVDAQPDDLIEVWANGQQIVTVRGRLGYRDSGRQYFKIGPYRDPADSPVVAYLDNFGLGHSFEDVDPRRFDR
ncbi:heparin lyase I family protein [Inquilinus limosus]|uniref:heparin lyase I family protein n=1 Tax=Inquilinus limosus TaxID=171674 RepID=UPI0003FA8B2A|nr:heparin lyase I family protein [Inquilinus limosus]